MATPAMASRIINVKRVAANSRRKSSVPPATRLYHQRTSIVSIRKKFVCSAPVRLAFPVRLYVEGWRSAAPADREPWTQEEITHAYDRDQAVASGLHCQRPRWRTPDHLASTKSNREPHHGHHHSHRKRRHHARQRLHASR